MRSKMEKNRKLKIIIAILLCFIIVCSAAVYFAFSNNDNSNQIVATYDETKTIQQRLKDLGYYKGEVDGIYGNGTRAAVKSFQYDYGLAQTGEVNSTTADYLGINLGGQSSNDLYLIAKCIYAEARGEPYAGKVAVGAVILNRVKDPNFPNTIYGVVYQPWAFTAVYDGQITLEPDAECYQAAQDAMNGWDPTYGCIYYYNPATATSQWIFSRKVVTQIGKHVFAV